jgi:hypothetical protein
VKVEDVLATANSNGGAPAPNGANPGNGLGSADAIVRFLTAAELRESAPEEPPWVWNGYAALGAITMLAGAPSAGRRR